MKPEVTTFSSGERNKILIVDDDGGYAVLGYTDQEKKSLDSPES